MKRNQDLSSTPHEQTSVLNLVTKIQTVLDNIALSPGAFDACVSKTEIICGRTLKEWFSLLTFLQWFNNLTSQSRNFTVVLFTLLYFYLFVGQT